jgi:hypothetical protein
VGPRISSGYAASGRQLFTFYRSLCKRIASVAFILGEHRFPFFFRRASILTALLSAGFFQSPPKGVFLQTGLLSDFSLTFGKSMMIKRLLKTTNPLRKTVAAIFHGFYNQQYRLNYAT